MAGFFGAGSRSRRVLPLLLAMCFGYMLSTLVRQQPAAAHGPRLSHAGFGRTAAPPAPTAHPGPASGDTEAAGGFTLARHHAALAAMSPPPRRACHCCGWHGDEDFAVMGTTTDRACRSCGALERHRLACAAMGGGHSHTGLPLMSGAPRQARGLPMRVVHFGPHTAMRKGIDTAPLVDQIPLDFGAEGYVGKYPGALVADVSKLALPDGLADGVFIAHVLEHVADLEAALEHLRRVLVPRTGWLWVEVPCTDAFQTRDCRGMSPEELKRNCVQFDHVWYFNCDDFAARLAAAGLDCTPVWNDIERYIGNATAAKLLPAMFPRNFPTKVSSMVPPPAFMCHAK